MSDSMLHITMPLGQLKTPVDGDTHNPLRLEILVSDPDSLTELLQKAGGRERDEYALIALKIGLLSLRHARGQVDTEALKHQGERLLLDLAHVLQQSRDDMHATLTASLKEYFDPKSGRFQERVDRLIGRDGELEQVLRRQIGTDGSELAATLASHLGASSPIMKIINPEESDGLVSSIRLAIEGVLHVEQDHILREFSLDNKAGALSRLIGELTEEGGQLREELAEEVQHIVGEFSLDNADSALSRLVRRVEMAEQTITKEFSLDEQGSALSRLSAVIAGAKDAIDANLTLDSEKSALSRLKRELVTILDRHEQKVELFQTSVQSALEAMKVQREEAARSTRHGNDFEDVAADFIQREVRKSSDIPTRTGNSTGSIRNCKVGDLVVELGSECAAAGERFVVEIKEHAGYSLSQARSELETARKNRDATVGLLVFSEKTRPMEMDSFFRDGNDIFVVWGAEHAESDVILRAGLSLAKALCVRQIKEQDADDGTWNKLGAAILVVEQEAKRLVKMKTMTETIQSNSGKILEEVRKLSERLDEQVVVLRDGVSALKAT